VSLTEVLSKGYRFDEIIENMNSPREGFYVIMYCLSQAEFDIAGKTKNVKWVNNRMIVGDKDVTDSLDIDVDIVWERTYDRILQFKGIHYWKDRMPYWLRVTKYTSGQSKLIFDAVKACLATKPTKVYIIGSASDTWRAGLATEVLYRYFKVDIDAYDVFEVGGCYDGENLVRFIPQSIDTLKVEPGALLIDDRWPVTYPIDAINFTRKRLTYEMVRQPFFSSDGERETRDCSFDQFYEEIYPLKCNCYECALFYNMMNHYGVDSDMTRKLYEVIFTEAGHLNVHNSEEHLALLTLVYARRSRLTREVDLYNGPFDRADIDKVLGYKLGYESRGWILVENGQLEIVNYVMNKGPRRTFGLTGTGYYIGDKRLVCQDYESNLVIDLFIKREEVPYKTRFNDIGVLPVYVGDREGAVMIENRVQMAAVLKMDNYQVSYVPGKVNSLPKGHVEKGETPLYSALREFYEETIEKKLGGFFGYYQYPMSYNNYQYDYHIFFFKGKPIRSINWRDIVFDQRIFIRDLVNGQLQSSFYNYALEDVDNVGRSPKEIIHAVNAIVKSKVRKKI